MSEKRTALVISAHAADFVWRCGEAIALHQQLGYEVTVVCLSFGERGESAKLWKQGGMTLDRVKAARRREAEDAAAELGAHDIRFLDLGDYPLELDREARFRLVDIIREVQPGWMMSHSKWNPYNTDHMYATQVALECRMIAQAWGHNPGQKVLGAPQLYLFEPHQTEQMGWKPDVFLDITPVWEKKRAAIECMEGQQHLWEYYTNLARNRANHFRRNSGGQAGGRNAEYAEGFQSVFPRTVDELT
ncbi:PIG-L deacetylase family protein [Jhaorihella thermophila]|uniref:4-oxalomesaconate hydratase n=1 Tax=Jhaorihella thermophila TaxID=488547 RepID=A0A1H5TGB1_9RHOB|nr:PIG-L deacetylase family protein [Jhaorihella thermophila]SEF61804.1 4-oxalomesaconate hydratase [Jhaorihella thermophila]